MKKLFGFFASGKKKHSSNDTVLGIVLVAFLGIVMAVGLIADRLSDKK